MAEIALSESDDGDRLTVHVGDTITISLAENATTGYRWVLEQPGSDLFIVRDTTADYPGGAVGAGGTASFRVDASTPGTGTLRLAYRRPWESGDQRTFSVEVTVSPG